MVYRQRRTRYTLIAFTIALLIFVFISRFIEIPLTIKTYSEVFPKEKWLLTRGNSGEIVSNLIDFSNGHTAQYNISQFERGELVSVNFSKFLRDKKELSKGDTVVFMRSSNVQDQLVSAEGELEVALANLKSQSSSQKEPLIREAESRLKYTEEKLAQQKVLVERGRQLYEKNLSSKQEFEMQKWSLDLLAIECKIYNSQLENLRTGIKPEETKYLESQIASSQNRLRFLKKMESQLLIQSPICGKIAPSFSPDTLLNVSDIKMVVLHIPVKLTDLQLFAEGKKIPVNFPNISNSTYNGHVISIGKEVKVMSGQQVVFISVMLENTPVTLLPGMILDTSMQLRTINLFDHLVRLVTN